MSNMRFGEQSQAKRVIRGDFGTSSAKVAASAQCHPLDGTRNAVGTRPEKGVSRRSLSLRFVRFDAHSMIDTVRQDTVQITPFLLYSGHDSRREDRIFRSSTQASLRAARLSHPPIPGPPT